MKPNNNRLPNPGEPGYAKERFNEWTARAIFSAAILSLPVTWPLLGFAAIGAFAVVLFGGIGTFFHHLINKGG